MTAEKFRTAVSALSSSISSSILTEQDVKEFDALVASLKAISAPFESAIHIEIDVYDAQYGSKVYSLFNQLNIDRESKEVTFFCYLSRKNSIVTFVKLSIHLNTYLYIMQSYVNLLQTQIEQLMSSL